MKQLVGILFLLLILAISSSAQSRVLTGTITSKPGESTTIIPNIVIIKNSAGQINDSAIYNPRYVAPPVSENTTTPQNYTPTQQQVTTTESNYQYKTQDGQPIVETGNNSQPLTPPASFHYNKKVNTTNSAEQNTDVSLTPTLPAGANRKVYTAKKTYAKWQPKRTATRSWRSDQSITDSLNGISGNGTTVYTGDNAGTVETTVAAKPARKWTNARYRTGSESTITDSLNALNGEAMPTGYYTEPTTPPVRKWVNKKYKRKSAASITDSLNALNGVAIPKTYTASAKPVKRWTAPVYQKKVVPAVSYAGQTPRIAYKTVPKVYGIAPSTASQGYTTPPLRVKSVAKVPCNCPAEATNNGSSSGQTVQQPEQQQNVVVNSTVKPDYKLTLTPDGKYNVTFSNSGSSVTLTQFGRISNVTTAGSTSQYNYRGLADNVGNMPLQYTYEGRVLSVGNAVLGYDYNGNIKSIGNTPLSYNYNGTLDKIGDTKVYYNDSGNVTGTSNANQNVVVKQ